MLPKEKFSTGEIQQSSTRESKLHTGKGNKRDNGGYSRQGSRDGNRDQRDRVSTVFGQLFSIRTDLFGLRRTGKLLIDSGSSINLIKENILHPTHPSQNYNKEFYMGNDKHLTTRLTNFKYLNQDHLFYIDFI